MTEYRFANPADEENILDFIDLVFSQSARPHDFQKLLPKAYAHPGFSAYHAIALEEGKIRGSVALLPMTLRPVPGEGALQGGIIGSVSVHGKARGKGYMKELMAMQIARAREKGYDFMILGGLRHRYGHWGFERAGGVVSFSFNQSDVRYAMAPGKTYRFAPVEKKDEEALGFISALGDSQLFSCRRPPEILYDTLVSYGGQPFLILDEANEKAGFLVVVSGKIVELTLRDEAALSDMIRCWMADKKDCTVEAPGFWTERVRALNDISEYYSLGTREMLKVLNWERMLDTCLRVRQALAQKDGAALPEGRRCVEIENEGAWLLEVKNGEAAVRPHPFGQADISLTERQAVSLFFSPLSALTQSDPLLRAWLPLPWHVSVPDTF